MFKQVFNYNSNYKIPISAIEIRFSPLYKYSYNKSIKKNRTKILLTIHSHVIPQLHFDAHCSEWIHAVPADLSSIEPCQMGMRTIIFSAMSLFPFPLFLSPSPLALKYRYPTDRLLGIPRRSPFSPNAISSRLLDEWPPCRRLHACLLPWLMSFRGRIIKLSNDSTFHQPAGTRTNR